MWLVHSSLHTAEESYTFRLWRLVKNCAYRRNGKTNFLCFWNRDFSKPWYTLKPVIVPCLTLYINQKYKYHRTTFCVNGCTFLSLIPKWFDCSICRIIKCFEWSLFRGRYSSVILIWMIYWHVNCNSFLCAATIPLVWMTIWRSRWTISDKRHCGFKLVYLRIADAQEFLRNVLEPEVHLVVHKHIYCCLNFSCAWLPAFSNQQQRVSSVLCNWLIRAYFLNVEVAWTCEREL